MITPSFGLTATERVLPKLALDFTTANLDSRVTLTRALNTATAINSSGNVAVVNANLPRFDYNPTTLACNGLLIEESRINSIRNNTMAGAVAGSPGTLPTNWSSYTPLTGLTRTIVGTGTENGITYIDIQFSGTPSGSGIYNINFDSVGGIAGLTGQTWTGSIYHRLVSGTLTGVSLIRFGLTEYNNASGQTANTFSASYPTITTNALITQRTSATITTSGGATTAYLVPYDQIGFTGAAVDFTLRFGLPQFEQGAFATSVIQTSSGAVTRNADVAIMTGTNFSDWYNQTQGAFEVEYSQYATGGTVLNASDGTSSNFINIFTSGANQKASCNVFVSGVNNGRLDSGGTFVANSNGKAVYSLIANNRALAYGGNAPSTSASPASMPVVDRLYIGSAYDGASGYNNGYIRKLAYYKQHIINAETQAFSK